MFGCEPSPPKMLNSLKLLTFFLLLSNAGERQTRRRKIFLVGMFLTKIKPVLVILFASGKFKEYILFIFLLFRKSLKDKVSLILGL